MGLYRPTENPCVMRREQLSIKMIYIASTTPQEIFHILDGKYPHDPSGTMIYQLRKYLEKS